MNANHDRYARLAARLLAPEVATDEVAADEKRDAVVAAMALAMAAKRRRRRTLVAGTVVALAAAASIALLVRPGRHAVTGAAPASLTVETMNGHGIELVREQAVQPLAPQAALFAGDVVRAAEGSTATLTTAAGTHLTLSSAAQLRVDRLSPSWRFSLSGGQLQAQVAKLGAGERFVVGMPEGEVEVRGTRFRVVVTTPAPGCGSAATRSTVAVDEGTVAVRAAGKELLLRPGESWASPCPEAATGSAPPAAPSAPGTEAAASPSTPSLTPTPRPAPRAAAKHAPDATAVTAPPAPPTLPAPAPVSRLAEQNDLFAAAMAAERQGQHDEALRRLDALLDRFPGGPLSESARAERQRILSAQTGR
jgi:hypothetical protein